MITFEPATFIALARLVFNGLDYNVLAHAGIRKSAPIRQPSPSSCALPFRYPARHPSVILSGGGAGVEGSRSSQPGFLAGRDSSLRSE